MLTLTIPAQGLQTVAGRHAQIIELPRCIQCRFSLLDSQ
jgi:hypothetical protein